MDDKTKSQEQVETKNEINKEESKIKRKKVNPLFIVLAFFCSIFPYPRNWILTF